jgi:radical SAM superfamily enzyme YgiQ (UPF0313 family)
MDFGTLQMTENMEFLELKPDSIEWKSNENQTRLLLVSINMPGYYSLPVRELSLISQQNDFNERFDTRYVEQNNNVPIDELAESIEAWKPDIVAMSVNIWNRNPCIELSKAVKEKLPKTVILCGGQEVSNSVTDYLSMVASFDYIIDGEGEIPFRQFLTEWDREKGIRNPHEISGLIFRKDGISTKTRAAESVDSLDDIPSSILAGLVPINEQNKLGVMLESARGCPFKCSFCFEGGKKSKVRMACLDTIIDEIDFMINKGATYFHIMDLVREAVYESDDVNYANA